MFSASLNAQNRIEPIRGKATFLGYGASKYSADVIADLTGAVATGYAWSAIGGTYAGTVSIAGNASQNPIVNITFNSGISNSILRCVIYYGPSGNPPSVNADVTVQWGP
jgi:hypothetical protein